MEILLDTHIVVWLLASPDEIRPGLAELLDDPANALFVSAATSFEIANKARLGKWATANALLLDWEARVARIGAEPLPLESADMLAAGAMNWGHRDPFDRMLAAQAIRRGMFLASADRIFGTLPGVRWLPG